VGHGNRPSDKAVWKSQQFILSPHFAHANAALLYERESPSGAKAQKTRAAMSRELTFQGWPCPHWASVAYIHIMLTSSE